MVFNKNLGEEIKDYQEVAKTNKNVDLAALMINALQKQDQHMVSDKQKHWAYLVSLGLPPLGLLFAVRFFFGSEDDAKTVAWICVGLTAFSVALFLISLKVFFSSTGASLQQIQQININDIRQLSQ